MVTEKDIGSVFRLAYPVVAAEAGLPQDAQMRIDPLGKDIQHPRPLTMSELVRQVLSNCQVGELNEFVVVTLLGDVTLVELSGQPFSPIDVNLDLKGKPALNADMHEAKFAIQVVVEIEM